MLCDVVCIVLSDGVPVEKSWHTPTPNTPKESAALTQTLDQSCRNPQFQLDLCHFLGEKVVASLPVSVREILLGPAEKTFAAGLQSGHQNAWHLRIIQGSINAFHCA